MGLKNPYRFWTGIVMGAIEVLGLGIYSMTLLNWDWLTTRLVEVGFVVSAIVLYNVLTITLIFSGSGNEEE